MELFNAVGLPEEVTGLPSWAPDYTFTARVPVLFKMLEHLNCKWYLVRRLVGRKQSSFYKGAGGPGDAMQFSADHIVLNAHGVVFDKVKSLHSGLYEHTESKQLR